MPEQGSRRQRGRRWIRRGQLGCSEVGSGGRHGCDSAGRREWGSSDPQLRSQQQGRSRQDQSLAPPTLAPPPPAHHPPWACCGATGHRCFQQAAWPTSTFKQLSSSHGSGERIKNDNITNFSRLLPEMTFMAAQCLLGKTQGTGGFL